MSKNTVKHGNDYHGYNEQTKMHFYNPTMTSFS